MGDRRQGIAFQNFVALIEKLVASNDAVTVESPAYVIDKDSKRRREFDVLITSTVAHHITKIAIECKDYGRKVGSGDVEAFQTKCERNHIANKVIVSSSGFSGGAIVKAAVLGIKLMEVAQAETFDWLNTVKGIAPRRMFDGVNLRIKFRGAMPEEPYKVFGPNGVEVSPMQWLHAINKAIPDEDGRGSPEPVERTVVLLCQGVYAVDASGRHFPVDEASTTVRMRWEVRSEPFETHTYKDGDGQGYDVVSHDLVVQGVSGKVILTRDAVGNETTSWLPIKSG